MNMRRAFSHLVILFIVLKPVQADEAESLMKSIKGGDIFEITKTLASPGMEGRLSGTEGYNRAARWFRAKFKEWGISPVYGDSYLQPLEISYNEMRETHFSLLVPAKNKWKISPGCISWQPMSY